MKFFQNSILKKNKKTQKGFSIGEVMIAGFVLSAGLVAVAGLIYKSITDSVDSRNHIIASELAQEGVELTRNSIDNARVGDSANFIPANFPLNDSEICSINFYSNPNTNTPPSLSCGSAHFNLHINNAGYYTTNTSFDLTRFKRRISVDYNDNTNRETAKMVTIISFVSWGNNNPPSRKQDCSSVNKCVYAETILRSWRWP